MSDLGRPDPRGLADAVRARALELGFSRVGITSAHPSEHGDFLERWLEAGHHGSMGYLARPDAVARRKDLSRTMEGVRSVVVVAHDYGKHDYESGEGSAPSVEDPSRGIVARYARGRDYHRVVKKRLLALLRWIRERDRAGALGAGAAARSRRASAGDDAPAGARGVNGRVYVDTGPLLERELGRRAGLGWFGRNTMLIDPKHGSYFVLGALLLDLELEPDPPFEADRCGTCRACLDACPTGALLGRDEDGAPVMDATLCISYLTIEHRGAIPQELRPAIGNRVFGCDICQEVCPFNQRFAEEAAEPGYASRGPGELPTGVEALPGEWAVEADGNVSAETSGVGNAVHPGTKAPSLMELLKTALDEEAWDAFSRGSAIRRAGRAGFARNVCVALGNWLASVDEPPAGAVADEEAEAVLRRALADEEPLIREHAAWALERADRG